MPARTRIWRKRGRARKLKYTWKSAGHPSIRKRIGDGQLACKQYTPCGCQQMCGKQCPCMDNGTCCEKYCGYAVHLFIIKSIMDSNFVCSNYISFFQPLGVSFLNWFGEEMNFFFLQ